MKNKFFIGGLLLLSILAVGAFIYFGKGERSPDYTFVTVRRGDLVEEVSVTGHVKPSEEVDLAFEAGGRTTKILARVGDKTEAGAVLMELENSELRSQLRQAEANLRAQELLLKQYQASLEVQEVKLEELEKGARLEEIRVSETKVANATTALEDAEKSLINVRDKADSDLAGLYGDVPGILNDVFLKANDALNKQLDDLFSNDNTQTPVLTFDTSDFQAKNDATFQRVLSTEALSRLETAIRYLGSSGSDREAALSAAESDLIIIRNLLTRLFDVLNTAVGLGGTTLAAHKANTNTALTNINTVISSINTQEQYIAAQKITNQVNIDAAGKSVNDAKSVLALAESELTLKKAGSTTEQISSQEAQVRQAEALLASQGAKIDEARANISVIQARIAKTILVAPFQGTVTRQEAKVGEIITANQEVVSIISEERFQIEANVPEADIVKVNVGDGAVLSLDAYGPETVFRAKVVHIDPAETVVEGVSTYKVLLEFEEADERLKPGMTADLDIQTATRSNILFVPQRAIISKDEKKYVRVASGDALHEIEVTAGLRSSDGNIEIIDGLKEGEKIILFEEK